MTRHNEDIHDSLQASEQDEMLVTNYQTGELEVEPVEDLRDPDEMRDNAFAGVNYF